MHGQIPLDTSKPFPSVYAKLQEFSPAAANFKERHLRRCKRGSRNRNLALVAAFCASLLANSFVPDRCGGSVWESNVIRDGISSTYEEQVEQKGA